ncbi:pyridine nucleotide-disulfide oxidoreductase [Curtobacterium sp. MCBD17_013]|uniref:NAD(P)/FAD-dependent oxidoreductase n=1 Tax=unclassified Curtobacterium TaxID=257496 RepID=UPI000DA95805|nr:MULTISPECIES: FAD-dependent oxidoreductase [unclassified Curtobacterium]PZF65124.1 pyridine nucleotide-disulfide oxidoreductase [Curtobacterium sp. MCBD17_013]WIB62225.1 FAD-dependent oxidoreductase [Curtobacterium sp. MCBD17_040]WIB66056.1 FAD-dependent oxidoreductase [Curtobacterium sp. MCBD17_035]
MADSIPHVLVLGGGSGGYSTVLHLQKQATTVPMRITLVDQNTYYTYLPFLPEVAGGHIAPRDVTVELRRALRRTRVIQGKVTGIDSTAKTVSVATAGGDDRTLGYDHVVVALGSVTRVFPTPGLEEHAVGFKSVEEAAFVRAKLLDNIAKAAATRDEEERRKLLTSIFIGGGYTGVEAIGELFDVSQAAIATYPSLAGEQPRWVLIDALDRVAPEVGPDLSKWTLESLRTRGIDVRLKTTMPSCEGGVVKLSDGDEFAAGLIVWTAGVKPNPVLDNTDLPRGPKGHLACNAKLQVEDEQTHEVVEGAWGLGDAAQVPDLTAEKQPAYYPPNAQNAVRQAVVVADNIVATITGQPIREYRHVSIGSVASYGIAKGAANIKGIKMTNLPAWAAHRAYHVYAMPTLNRKARIVIGWLTGAVSGRDSTSLIKETDPRREFVDAANS